jgi:hypothetical protein
VDYTLVEGHDLNDIKTKVRDHINMGWSCMGACQVIPTANGNGPWYCQTMILEAEAL